MTGAGVVLGPAFYLPRPIPLRRSTLGLDAGQTGLAVTRWTDKLLHREGKSVLALLAIDYTRMYWGQQT